MTDNTLHLVTADDVELVVEHEAKGQAALEAVADDGAEVSVWVPLAGKAVRGRFNGIDVVLFHVVAHDPTTGEEGTFALIMSREESLDWSRQLNSVGATVTPLKKQIERQQAARPQEEN